MDERTLKLYDRYQRAFLVYLKKLEAYLDVSSDAFIVRKMASKPIDLSTVDKPLYYDMVGKPEMSQSEAKKLLCLEELLLREEKNQRKYSSLVEMRDVFIKRQERKERERNTAFNKLIKVTESLFSDYPLDKVVHSFGNCQQAPTSIRGGLCLMAIEIGTNRVINNDREWFKSSKDRLRIEFYRDALSSYNSNTDEEPPTPYELEEAFLETRKKFLSLISTKKEG